jgi:alpha-L-fucosidase 2
MTSPPGGNVALAIGDGQIGAMVFGGVGQERLQLSDDMLWAGGPYDQANSKSKAALPEVRKVVFEANMPKQKGWPTKS